MNLTLEKLHISEYLEKERASSFRSDYIQGELRILTGVSFIHNKIVINLIKILSYRLELNKWEILSSDMKVWVPEKQSFYYPDLLVLPYPPKFYDEKEDIVTNPICIFEVLSESTQNIDKTEKLDAYKSIDGFKEYYLIEQGKPFVIQHKIISKNHWETQEFYELSSQIEISCLEIIISLQEIYNGVIKQT